MKASLQRYFQPKRRHYTIKHKMGDWNKDQTMRFWAYMKGSEAWVTPEKFDIARAKMIWWK